MRSLFSFLISLNAHVWGLVLLSLVFIYEQKPPEPQRIEVQFLKLPAPLEGSSTASSEAKSPETATATSFSRARVVPPISTTNEGRLCLRVNTVPGTTP